MGGTKTGGTEREEQIGEGLKEERRKREGLKGED